MTELLRLRQQADCRFDLVSLGEVMLRLDPGDERIATTRSFRAWEGGGEYNVARGLRRCFGLRTAVVTALADNPVGRLIEDLILQGGVDTRYLIWRPYDGTGAAVRNGLNFTERGFGIRGAVGCSDRAHSAASQLRPGDVDWHAIFANDKTRWLHCGGIFAGLSPSTAEVTQEAMRAARAAGTIISYDLNYRPSLWQANGGPARAAEVNRKLVSLVNVLFGNEEDLTAGLGYQIEGASPGYSALAHSGYEAALKEVTRDFPQLKLVATTLRTVRSASVNDWEAIAWAQGSVYRSASRPGLQILDRVGGGDSFASGMIYGLLTGLPVAEALEYGAAHGALAMTTPGDTSMATLDEVKHLVAGGTARAVR